MLSGGLPGLFLCRDVVCDRTTSFPCHVNCHFLLYLISSRHILPHISSYHVGSWPTYYSYLCLAISSRADPPTAWTPTLLGTGPLSGLIYPETRRHSPRQRRPTPMRPSSTSPRRSLDRPQADAKGRMAHAHVASASRPSTRTTQTKPRPSGFQRPPRGRPTPPATPNSGGFSPLASAGARRSMSTKAV